MSDAHSTDHPAHLAHHFDTPDQQFDTAKMGMWVFLATEILMFGGLFCAYAIYRGNNPDMFMFAHKALDTQWGAINTVVLLVSSFTMAWGVRASQLGHKGLLVTLLALTLAGGAGFMVIKTIEYKSKWKHDLFAGGINVFHPASETDAGHTIEYIEKKAHGGDKGHGDDHAAHGGSDDHAHEAGHDDHADAADDTHHAEGDAPNDAHTPPVEDQPAVAAAKEPATPALLVSYAPPADMTSTPAPRAVSAGVATAFADEFDRPDLKAQLGIPAGGGHSYPRFGELTQLERERTHVFFQIYFLMTGLHGLHVLIGMGLITWILIRAVGGVFGPSYFTPVDLVGLYWHLVDLIWIFLFPLLYLIH